MSLESGRAEIAVDVVAAVATALWVGGMVFFAIGVAPAAFGVLPDRTMAGNVVSASMRTLHALAYGCGGVIVACFLLQLAWKRPYANIKLVLAAVMLVVALYSGLVVSGELSQIRASAGAIDALALTDPVRQRFDWLHQLSVKLMSFNILAGLVLVGLDRLKTQDSRLKTQSRTPTP